MYFKPKFSEPQVCITLLVSPPLICAESVRFDVVSTENVRITSVTVDGKNGTIALHMSRPKCYIFIKVLHVCVCVYVYFKMADDAGRILCALCF